MNIQEEFLKRYNPEEEYLGLNKKVNNIKPLVSVCIATYQHVNYIQECIEGALLQKTNFPIEIIIGEDGSTDGTREICLKYASENQDKIRLFLRDRKTSQLYNVNGAFVTRFNGKWNRKAAKGKYIAMCEGDDYWTDPYKLQRQVDFLEVNPDFVLTYHDFHSVQGLEQKRNNSPLTASDKMDATCEDLLLYRKWIKTLTMCFRNVVKDYPQEIYFVKNQDLFLLSLLGNYGKGKWMGEEIMPGIYREHGGGVWSSINTQQRNIDFINTYYWVFQYYSRIGKIDIAKLWFSKMIRHLNMIEQTTLNQQENIFGLYEKQKNHLNMIKNSMPYKIGRFITSPVRYFKTLARS